MAGSARPQTQALPSRRSASHDWNARIQHAKLVGTLLDMRRPWGCAVSPGVQFRKDHLRAHVIGFDCLSAGFCLHGGCDGHKTMQAADIRRCRFRFEYGYTSQLGLSTDLAMVYFSAALGECRVSRLAVSEVLVRNSRKPRQPTGWSSGWDGCADTSRGFVRPAERARRSRSRRSFPHSRTRSCCP